MSQTRTTPHPQQKTRPTHQHTQAIHTNLHTKTKQAHIHMHTHKAEAEAPSQPTAQTAKNLQKFKTTSQQHQAMHWSSFSRTAPVKLC